MDPLDPSPPSPFARAGGTVWSVWYYVAEAVGRFLRPQVIDNDGQEPEESNVRVEGAEETRTDPTTSSVENRPQSTVTWEECDSNNGVGPAKENVQYTVQFTRGSDGHTLENDEGEIEEQIADTGPHVAKEMATEEEEVENDGKQHLIVKVTRTLKTDENEELDYFGSSNLTHETLSDNMEETNRNSGLEEIGGIMAHEERQNVDETLRNVQVKDWNEGEEVLIEDEPQDLKDACTARCSGSEDYAGQLCTSVSPEKDSSIYREDLALARQEEGRGMEHEADMRKETERHTSVSEQASALSDSEDENDLTSDEGSVEHGGAGVEEAMLLCEEILHENSDVTASEVAQDAQLQTTGAVENKNTELSGNSEHIDHLTVTDGKAQLTGINIPVDEEKTRPDEGKVNKNETAPIEVKIESNNGGEITGNLTHVTLSDDMEESKRNSGLEEEIGEIMANDEGQKVDETFRNVQVKDGNEGEEVLTEDEAQSLKDACTVHRSGSEDNSGQLYTSVSQDDNIYREDVALVRLEEEEGNRMEHEAVVRKETERHTSVSEQASTLSDSEDENDLTSDEDLVEHDGADVQEAVLVCEEICDENSDVTASEAAQDAQLKMTYNKRAESDHDITVAAQVMGETLLKTENDANDLEVTEDGSIAVEREKDVEIKAQIDDKGKEMTKSNILDFGFEAEVIAEDDMGTEHIQVSEPVTENMEIQLKRAKYEGGNQDCIAALLGTVTQTTENVAVENQSMEPSVMFEHIDHLTVTDGNAQLTEINIPFDEEKTRPDEDKVSSSEEDIVHKKKSAFTPIAVKNESNNGGEITGNLTHVTLSDNMEETNRNIGLEEEIGAMMAHDERQNVDVQVKDGNEGEEVLFEEETQSLKDACTVLRSGLEENSGQLYMSVSPEKDGNIYREDVALLRQEEEEGTGMEHETDMRKDTERGTSVSEQASTLSDSEDENNLTSDEELVEHGRADVQRTMLLCEEIFDENSDVTASEVAQDTQMTYNKRVSASDHDIAVGVQVQVMGERLQKTENKDANYLNATEDGSIAVEREQDVEIKAQIDDKEKEITKSNILAFGFEAEVIAKDDMGTDHIQVSEPVTENMEIQLNRAQYEGGNQDCIAALLGKVTQTTKNVAVENQSMEPSVMFEHIDHLTVTDGNAQLTEINIPFDEEKTRPDEDKVSSSEEDIVHKKESAVTPIAVKNESNNGGEGTGNLTHVTLSDNMEEINRNIGLEEEIGAMMAHDERQNVDIQVKDGNEGEEVLFEEETQSLKDACTVLRSGSEENSGQLYMSVSPEKDSNIYREDVALLRQEEEEGRGMEHEADMRKDTERGTSVSEQASTLSDSEDENNLTSDEGLVEHSGRDAQEAMLLCEEILDENSDVTASEVAQDAQLKMTYYNKRAVSDHDMTQHTVAAQVTGETLLKTENDANDLNATEDGSIAVEREQDVEIKAQIDDKEKEITKSNILDCGFEAEGNAEEDIGTKHIQVSEPITENMEMQLNRAQFEDGNQDCITALLGTVTQTTENVAVENQSMEPSVISEHIDHLTVTDGKAQLTEIHIPVDEEKPRPDEDKVSSSEADIVNKKETAPIEVKIESNNGGERTGNLTHVTLSDNIEETSRNIGLEEEIGAMMAHDERQNVDIEVKDGNEGEEVLFEEETQRLKDACTVLRSGSEENSCQLYMSVSPEKNSNIYREDVALLRQEEEEGRGMEHEADMRKDTERGTSVSEQASTLSDSEDENDLTSDEELVEHGRADVQEAMLLCEEILYENSDVTASEAAQGTQLQMTYNKRAAASDHDLTVGVQVQMMGERLQKTENNDANDLNATEDGSIAAEREQDVEIKAQIDDKEKEMTKSNILDFGFEAEVIAEDDMGTEHIQVSEPVTENMEIQLNRAQYEGGNQDCITALLGTVTQTTENVAVENQSMKPSVMSEQHIDHLTVTDGKAQLTEINIPVDEEKPRPDEDKVSSSEEDIVHTKESAVTPIAVKNESNNGGERTGNLTHVTLSDNMEETNRNIGLKEEIGAMMAHDERQNVDIQVKDGNEGEEVLFEEETQSLKDACTVLRSGSEENSGQLYMSVSPENDGNIYREDVALLRLEEEEGNRMEHEAVVRKETERHTSVSEQASTLSDSEDENDLTSDEGLVEQGGADVQEAVLLCEEICDENSDVTASEAAQDTQLKMTYNKRAASDHDITVAAQVMGETLLKTENDANDLEVTEDGSIAVEREKDVEIKAQIDDKGKEMTKSNILDFGFEAEVIAEDDMGTEHIQVSEPVTENMEIQLKRAKYEGGNQDCIAALLGTVTQTTENVAVENQSMEPSVMSEHIDHLTVTDGKAQLTEINIPVDEEKPRPDEDKVSSSEEDIVHTKESAVTPIAVKNESNNGGEGTGNLTHVTLSDNMEETNRNNGLKEEIGTMMAHDERQNVDIQVKDGNEGEEVLFEEETQSLKDACTVLRPGSEENSGQLYMSVSPEKDSNIYREDVALLRQEEEEGRGMEHEADMRKDTERGTSVSEQASTLSDSEDENDLTSDEELVEHGRADVQKTMLLCEEIFDENSDVTASEAAQDIQLQMTYNKRKAASDHDLTVGVQVQMMGERLQKTENNDANDLNATEDGSIAVEREQDVEIKAQIDDKEKEMTKSNILDFGFEAEVIAEDDMGTEHIQVSEPVTENMEIQLNRAQYEGGNQDCIAALLGTVTQTTENVAVENQSMEPSVMSEHIDHLTVTDGKAQLTEINIPVDEEKPRPDEDKVSSSEEDIVHTKESAVTPIAVKNESNNGGEGPGNLTHVMLSDNMEETNRNIGLEEEIGAMMAHDERQNVDIQVKDGNEGEEVLFEDETQSLKDACTVLHSESEENSGQLYMSVSPEKDSNIYREDVALLRQKEEEGTGMEHETAMRKETERYTSVSEQASTLSDSEDENDLTSDEGLVEHGGADVQEAMLLCEEICDENSDVTASEVAQDTQLQMTYNKRATASGHDITVGAQVMDETLLKTENKDANDLNTTDDGSIAVEREQCVEIDSQIDDKGKEMTKGIILDCRFDAESSTEDDMRTEHIQVSEPMTETMETQLNRAQYEGGNQDAVAALLQGTVTQTTVAVENQSTELSGIGHLTVTDGKAHLTDLHFPGDEEKTRPEENVSNSEEDIINKNESALAVKTESNNGGEIMGVLRSTSPEMSDRLVVVPLKLNSVVCEETQEGVPQYDNNRHELYEDTTQRILEVGDYEEIQSTQLPEEVGSKDLESFIKTVGSGEAGHLFIHGEEQGSKLENALQIENMFDMVAEGHTGTLCLTDTELPREKEEPSTEPMDETPAQVSACISTAEFGPVDASLTTGARHSEHVSETDASSQDETRGTDAEPSAQTAELLAEINNEPDIKNGPVMDTQNNTTIEENVDDLSAETMEFPEAELNKVKVTGFVYEPIDPTVLEENISQTISLAESIVETRMMEQPSATWPILNEEVQFMAMDVQDAGLNMQEIAGPGIKKTTAEKENSSEIINLQKMETATSKTTDGEENALFETDIDINTEQLLESIEINHEMFNKQHCTRMEKAMAVGFYNESLDIKSEPELITSEETEITRHGKADKVTELVGEDVRGMGGPHETDDEILDMWIETVLCKDTDNTEPQMIRKPTKREPEETEDEETGSGPDEEMSKLTEKEPQRVSINNEEPETELALGGETEILETSPLVESGYTAVGQFPCEGASAENETAILKLSGAEVFQAIHETADSMSEFVISALSVKSSEIEDGDTKGADETQDSCVQEDPSTHAIHMHTGFLNNTYDATTVLSEAREDELSYQSQEHRETDIVELMGTETGLQVIDPEISDSDLQEKTNWEISKGMEEKSQTTCALFQGEAVNTEDKLFGAIALNITDEMKEVNSGKTYKSQEAESEVLGQRSEPLVGLEGRNSTESDLHKKTCLEGQDQLRDVLEALSGRKAASSPVELSTADDAEELATPLPTPGDQLEFNTLDFTPQKTRIAIKNPYVRPPKDPRALLQMPSAEPTPPKPSGRLPMKGLTAVSMGGLGIGIKLPGFGAGFPVLKKTNVSREENRTEDCPQKETETKLEVNDGSPEPVVVLEGRISRESDLHKKTCLEGQDQLRDVLDKALSGRKAASSPVELRTAVDAEELATPLPTPGDQLEFNTLDFTPQKTRIAIKNPYVRPPKDPRALLQMPSAEPTPPKPSGRLPMKGLTAVSMGGLGIGIKLPGFGAAFPVLKKTNVSREENLTEDCPQKETETKQEVNDGSPESVVLLEGRISRESDLHKKTCLEGQDQLRDVLDKAHSGRKAASSPVELRTAVDAEELATPLPTPGDQLEFNTLDFTPQKTRIAIKNPHVRPPKDPRALLQMPSAEPTPSKPSGRLPMKRLAGVPMAGLGIGIKLPGFGAGFPVLKKTTLSREENLTEDCPQKGTETKLEVNDAEGASAFSGSGSSRGTAAELPVEERQLPAVTAGGGLRYTNAAHSQSWRRRQLRGSSAAAAAAGKCTRYPSNDGSPRQDVAEHKPKWMPPRQPGFGNPLMSELKNKLKKTAKE